MLERLEKKLQDKGLPAAAKEMIQKQIDDLKGVERKASPEEERNAAMALAAEAAAAAQGAAGGGGGDDARREDILAALAFVKEVEREAAEVVSAAAAEAKAAYKVVKDKSDALTPAQRSKIRAITFSVEYGPLGRQSAESMKHDEAERALERARTWAKETVEKAQADVDAVRAGKPYAAVLEEREAVRRQNQAPEPESKEGFRQKVRESLARGELRQQEVDAAIAWAKTQPEIWKQVYSVHDTPTENKLIALHKQALAQAAAAPSGSSAE